MNIFKWIDGDNGRFRAWSFGMLIGSMIGMISAFSIIIPSIKPKEIVIEADKEITGAVVMGNNSFCDVDNCVVIGDDIQGLDRRQIHLMFIGERMVIGETLFGKPFPLRSMIDEFIREVKLKQEEENKLK